LTFFLHRETSFDPLAHSIHDLETPLRSVVLDLWEAALADASAFTTEVVGPQSEAPEVSVITVLYESLSYFPVQCAVLFQDMPRDRVEIILANNSPHLQEELLRECEIAHKVYGISFKIIMFSGNTGFGHANNVAAEIARSRRLILVNPDILPFGNSQLFDCVREEDWFGERKIFGPALMYANGVVMHGGMGLVEDRIVGRADFAPSAFRALRVDHFLKGAPPEILEGRINTPVPAVTGAFIGVSKSFFQELGGFRESYIFGHYEDADLCLRAWEKGGAVIFSPSIRFYHFEGQGAGPRQPFHDGASLVNRCLFTGSWINKIDSVLDPSRVAMRGSYAIHGER